jgi:hypothetical protein
MVSIKLYRYIFILLTSIFVGLTGWWLFLHLTNNTETTAGNIFAAVYGVVALIGGVYGLATAKSWGFFKSYFGKAIIFLSLGLLLQEFGQLAYSYAFSLKHIELPYPSVPDIGYFGSIPMYAIGAFYLMRGLGTRAILKKNPIKLVLGVMIPVAMLGVSYWFFLKSYDTTGLSSLTVFFDFGYPLGQSVYVSLALVMLLSVGKMLGGVMRGPVLLLLLAFMLQYAADFNFLYQNLHETWTVIGYGDYLYLLAYFVLGLSLISLNRALAKAFAKGSPNGGS